MNLTLDIYQIDAFSEAVFSGNPAAVVPLDQWPDDAILQAIASENNLSETAFFRGGDGHYRLRWFTPSCEVPLCGHATLASAYVIFRYLEPEAEVLQFETLSGILSVGREGDLLVLDFPAYAPVPCEAPERLAEALGSVTGDLVPEAAMKTEQDHNYYFRFSDQSTLAAMQPDMALLAELHPYGVVVTAPGDDVDFVSRYFAPSYGIPEDPVTGSIHCALIPLWSDILGKTHLQARQISGRGGHLLCDLQGDRVRIKGKAVQYLCGRIDIT